MNRVQGLSSTRYASEHGLPGNAMSAVSVDSNGRVWAASCEGGLAWFDGDGWQLMLSRCPRHQGAMPAPFACCAALDEAGGVWVATSDGVYRIDDPQNAALPVALRPKNEAVDALTLLADGETLLLGNAWGLFRLRVDGSIQQIAAQTLTECTALHRDGKGTVWAAATGGLYQIVSDRAQRIDVLPGNLRIVALAGGRSRLWALDQCRHRATGRRISTGAWCRATERWDAFRRSQAVSTTPISGWAVKAALAICACRLVSVLRLLQGKRPRPHGGHLSCRPIHTTGFLCVAATPWLGQTLGRIWVGTADGVVIIQGETVQRARELDADVRSFCRQETYGRVWLLAYPNGVVLGDEFAAPEGADGISPFVTISGYPGFAAQLATGIDGQPLLCDGSRAVAV